MKQYAIILVFLLSACSTHSVIDNITPVVVENVFQCSSGIIERSELLSKYSKLKEKNTSEYEIKIALEKSLSGAGMSETQFLEYNKCIQKLNTLQQKHKSTMSVVLSEVINDKKSRVVNSLTLTSDDGEAFSDKKMEEVNSWIRKYVPVEESRKIDINIPEKITTGTDINKLITNIDGLNPTYYIWKSGQMKARFSIPNGIIHDESQLSYPFSLEVSIPGYHPVLIHLKSDSTYHESHLLKKIPVKIAIEKFSGVEHSVAERLAKTLGTNRKDIDVYDPSGLEKIREDMAKHQEDINRNPVAQIGFRAEMPNYILSGSITNQLDR